LISLFAMMSSAAGAVTWTNSGQTAFTAASLGGTLSVTSVPLTCAGSDASGTAPATVTTPSVASGTVKFTGCTVTALRNVATIDCGYTFTASSFDGVGMAGSVVTGAVDVTCGVYQSGTKICHIGGLTNGSYTNNTSGTLDIPASSTLVTSNGPTGTCPLGAGEVSSLTALRFTVLSGTGPIITRD
jgi:hypothetical protein